MKNLENIKESRLKDPEFKKRVMEHVVEVFTDTLTNPNYRHLFSDPQSVIDRVERGEKLEEDFNFLNGALVVAGQDMGLSPDEIDKLKTLVFEKPHERFVKSDE